MRAYRIERFGSVDGLELRECDDPQPGPGEVRMRVRACSLNYKDLVILNLPATQSASRTGLIPLGDGAGEIDAVGEGVTRWRAGDRAIATYFPHWLAGPIRPEDFRTQLGDRRDGMLRERAVLSQESLVKIPSHLSFEEAATLPTAALTAWNALAGDRSLFPGQTILTLGSGGVSVFAVQLGRAFGTHVIATTSSEAKAARLRELGAHEVVDYVATPNWDARVRELTNGRGVDLVVEVGGTKTLPLSIRATRLGGRISLLGNLAGSSDDAAGFEALGRTAIRLRNITAGSRDDFEDMNAALELHRIHPVIDRTFDFVEAKEAFRYFQERRHFGKVVIAQR